MRRALVLVGSLLVARASLAASVVIEVSEEGAGPVSNQPVAVFAVTPENLARPGIFTRPAGRCVTGVLGSCAVEGLAAGVYTADVRPIVDPNLCTGTGTPAETFGTVTLGTAEAKARLRIALQRGVQVRFRVATARDDVAPGTRVELTGESGESVSVRVASSGRASVTLPAGRWVAHLVGPPRALLVAVDLDGNDLETADVTIDVVPPSSDRFVTWTLSAPCQVFGTVTSNRPRPGVAVGGVLLAPGPWASSSFCRATDCAGSPHDVPGPTGWYGFEVACGSWRIAPSGESLVESNPPFTRVDLKDGEMARADFSVRETESDPGPRAVLTVRVESPEGRSIASAPVELWPPGGLAERNAPLSTEATGPFGTPARFVAVAAGSYLLRVRVPGYRTAVQAALDVDPNERSPRQTTVRLSRGAVIDARIRDDKDRPATGVGLAVTRVDGPPATDDPAERLAAQDDRIEAPPSVDQTGHLLVTGLAGGTFRVRPVPSPDLAAEARIVVGRAGERGDDETTVRLEEDGRVSLDVRVTPAASLRGRLVCADGAILPRMVEACVLRGPSRDENETSPVACRDAVVPVRKSLLAGDDRNEFRVGPLAPGTYRLGLRPEGYASWTWALGTPEASTAALLQIEGTSPVELGTVKVLCGPAIEVRPTVRSGDELPDLSLAIVGAGLSRPSKDGKTETIRLTPERSPDRIAFRELPEGDWTLELTISHPFFVPNAPVAFSTATRLERGALVVGRPEVPAVGGAVAVTTAAGAARLVGATGASRVEASHDGRVTFAGVAPGAYRVELCEDAHCARASRTWRSVQVTRGTWIEVAADAVAPAVP